MAENNRLGKELTKILSLKVTGEEEAELRSRGINIKRPTKLTLLAVSLFEKGLKGELSAIKEILLQTGEINREGGGVIFIDDIRNKD